MPSAGEKAIFAYFFWRLQKSMASGGTRPAGLDFNGGEMLQVAGNFLPSAKWADINVGRFCWEGMRVREGVGACLFFFTAAGNRRVAVCCLKGRGKTRSVSGFPKIFIFLLWASPCPPLDFRHTFGSQLAVKGESLYKISNLMGNSSEICRRHYAALIPVALADCVEF